jgi:hypothetical protein
VEFVDDAGEEEVHGAQAEDGEDVGGVDDEGVGGDGEDGGELIGNLADGKLWLLGPHEWHPVPPIGPDVGRIIAAYNRILRGSAELAMKEENDPQIALDAQRVPGLGEILSGLRALHSASEPTPKNLSHK